MDSEYVHMKSNPPHLIVRFDQGVNPIRDMSPSEQPKDTQDGACGGPSEAPIELSMFEDDDVLKCIENMYFIKNDTTNYHARVLELYAFAPQSVSTINKWLSERLVAIEGTCKDAPICKGSQCSEAGEELLFLKSLAHSIDEIPETLQKVIPESIDFNDRFTDYLNEDLMCLQNIIFKRIEVTRSHIKAYQNAIKRLSEKQDNVRQTRSDRFRKILDGTDPIDLHLLEPDLHEHDANHIYSTIGESNDDSLCSQSNISSSVDIDGQTAITSVLPTNSKDGSSRLEMILEEPLTEDQRAQLVSFVKEIVGQDSLDDINIDDPSIALEILEDRLGVSLDLNETDIMDKVATICQSKRMFKNILSRANQEKRGLTCTPAAGDIATLRKEPSSAHSPANVEDESSSIISSPLLFDSNQPERTPTTHTEYDDKFYTPGTTAPMTFYTIYHTAHGGVQSTVPAHELQTPIRQGIVNQRSLVDAMSLSTINSGLQMYTHDPAITQDAQYIGPNLDSGTTLSDLDRHQRADVFPPVRAKAQHKQLSHKDLDLSYPGYYDY